MKNILLSLAVAASSSLYATEVIGNYHIGVGSATNTFTNATKTGKVYTLGGSLAWLFESGILLGGRVDYHFLDSEIALNSNDNMALSADIKVGYRYSDFTVYGLGGYRGIDGKGEFDNYLGFGYGAGLSWNIFDKVSIAVEYKDYTMDGVVQDFNYKTTGVFLKYGN